MTDTAAFQSGEDLEVQLRWSVNDADVDIIGYTVTGDVLPLDGSADISLTVANGGIVLSDPSNGRFKALLTEAQTALLPIGALTELWLTLVSGASVTSKFGPILLERTQ